MIEIFTAFGMGELGAYILSLGSPLLALVALVVVSLITLYKLTKAITEFRNTDEMKDLVSALKTAHADNTALKKANKKLIQELTRKIDLGDLDDGKED